MTPQSSPKIKALKPRGPFLTPPRRLSVGGRDDRMSKSRRRSLKLASEVVEIFRNPVSTPANVFPLESAPSLDMQIVHQNPSHHHLYPPRELSNIFASFYFMECNGIPICACLKCALYKSKGKEVGEGCQRPVVKREGGNWVMKECWKVKREWDKDLMIRAREGEFGDPKLLGIEAGICNV
ncbi:hypothetical protein TrCOL_g5439 [Triparma columacea]|uniref:Uncharacterized protein n=1 Tax=Triparma columacea TaxID=722753 RepID=A0A9W7GLS0_9STRA|nr:hypothetical protein TrCOL_g5439 [Triparma columacea]